MTDDIIEDIEELVRKHYPDADDFKDGLFQLLVVTADLYVVHLESEASDDPAPYLCGTTPMDAAMFGLRENLDMIRGN